MGTGATRDYDVGPKNHWRQTIWNEILRRCHENVNRVREEGRPALKGDMIDLLWSWPEDWPVCAGLMDFCSGIEWGNGGAYDPFETKPLRNAAIMVNFMRGRDRATALQSTAEMVGLPRTFVSFSSADITYYRTMMMSNTNENPFAGRNRPPWTK